MEEKVVKTITKYNLIQEGDKIVVGVSGGPDSMCLLNLLLNMKEKYKLNLYVAHINHGIRKNAILDEEYVRLFCEKNNIPVYIKRENVLQIARDNKIGTEEAGRNVRYNFFEEVLNETNSNKIAIAHNSNDRAETVIMNIIRGSGISGLKGIEPIRDNKYIRPLIEISRQEIEEYTKENHLNPRYDESNDTNIYTRNKIRNIVIPYIKEQFNPNIIQTINRLSSVATEESEYIEKKAIDAFDYILEEVEKSQIILNLKKFNELELVIKRRVILYTINKLVGTTNGIERINIEDIIKLCSNNIGNKYLTPIKKLKILVKDKKIFYILDHNLP